jgi:hypothetical protein
MIKFTEEELFDILVEASEEWCLVSKHPKDKGCWGYDEEIVFTHINGRSPFYAFTKYVGSGSPDFEPSDVYTVYPKEVTITEWIRIND